MLRLFEVRRSRRRGRTRSALPPISSAVETLESRTLLSGHATDGGHFHAVFAPGTSDEYVLANSDTPENASNEFRTEPRWSTTATNGGGLGQGDPTVLTWSIVPDGTAIPALSSVVGESADPSDLVTFLGGIYGVTTNDADYTDEPWFTHFDSVFARWSELSGITYVYEPNDDGAAFTDMSSSAPGVLGTRGDVRIGGHYVDGAFGALAYNAFPDHGEMVIDTSDIYFNATSNNSIGLRNVLSHEAGHGIGIHHVESDSANFLMEPSISTSFDGPQLDDVLAVHRLYGDGLEDTAGGNDSFANATSLGPVAAKSLVVAGTSGDTTSVTPSETDFLSIDDDSDVDYFSFSLPAAAEIDFMLDPVGPTYNEGPQGGPQSPFDAQSISDLTLDVLDSDGTTVLASSNFAGVGGSEVIPGFPLGAGTYFVRVSGSADNVQLYRLSIDNDAVSPTGTIAGTKFHDLDGDRFRDPGEPGLPGWTIYVDTNENGVFDEETLGVEPDDFAIGQNLSTIDPNVTLSEVPDVGSPPSSDVFSMNDGSGFASTGTQSFSGTNPYWGDILAARMRMDFHVDVTSVSIDAVAADLFLFGDVGRLQIYDASNNLLGTYTTATLPQGAVETMTLASTTPIAYAIAYGLGSIMYLDNLSYTTEEPSTTTDSSGAYAFADLPNGTYRLGEVPQAGWVQTAPAFGRLFAAVDFSNEILEIDPATGAELNRFAHPGVAASGADGLAFDGTSLFFSDRTTLFELNPNDGSVLDTDTLSAIGVGTHVDALGYFNGQIVASNEVTNELYFIDPASDTLASVVPLHASIDAIGGLTGAPSRGTLFITDLISDVVYEVDPTSGAPLNSFPVTVGPPNEFGLAFVSGSLFVGDTSGDLHAIDPDTGALLGTTSFGFSNDFSALGGDGGADGFRVVSVLGQTVTGVDFGNRLELGPLATEMFVNGGSANRSGISSLTILFDSAVTISAPSALTLFNHTTGLPVVVGSAALQNNGTTEVTWNLNGFDLPDGFYSAELPANAATPTLARTETFFFGKLLGDLDGDGAVNFDDTAPISLNFGTAGGTPFGDGDADGDGDVNFDDTAPISLSFGASLTAPGFDFGDAPETGTSFSTTLANDGARHVASGNTLFLGTTRDVEPDGQPTAGATGDGSDEDGVMIANGGVLETETPVDVEVTASEGGFLNVWIDYNQNGDWRDVGEHVVVDLPLMSGTNTLSLIAPLGTQGVAAARFRLTGTSGYSHSGPAVDGEIEDYMVTIANATGPASDAGAVPTPLFDRSESSNQGALPDVDETLHTASPGQTPLSPQNLSSISSILLAFSRMKRNIVDNGAEMPQDYGTGRFASLIHFALTSSLQDWGVEMRKSSRFLLRRLGRP